MHFMCNNHPPLAPQRHTLVAVLLLLFLLSPETMQRFSLRSRACTTQTAYLPSLSLRVYVFFLASHLNKI